MRRRTISLTLFSLTMIAAYAHSASPAVEDLAAVDRLDFVGGRFASPEQLSSALDHDLEFLLACDPTAPLDDFLAIVARGLTAGYHRAGFALARVDARANLQTRRVTVTIDEGPRLRAGAVRLVGGGPLSPTNLADWLVAPVRRGSRHALGC